MKSRTLLITLISSCIVVILGAMLKVMGVKIISSSLLVFGTVIIISSIIAYLLWRRGSRHAHKS